MSGGKFGDESWRGVVAKEQEEAKEEATCEVPVEVLRRGLQGDKEDRAACAKQECTTTAKVVGCAEDG